MTRTHEKVGAAPAGRPVVEGPETFWAHCDHGAVEGALRLLEGRWKMTILFCLFSQPTMRYFELERLAQGISQKMLSQQLRQLEKDGLIARTVYPTVPPQVEYGLTESGLALRPALTAFKEWALRYNLSDMPSLS